MIADALARQGVERRCPFGLCLVFSLVFIVGCNAFTPSTFSWFQILYIDLISHL